MFVVFYVRVNMCPGYVEEVWFQLTLVSLTLRISRISKIY